MNYKLTSNLQKINKKNFNNNKNKSIIQFDDDLFKWEKSFENFNRINF